MAGEDEQLGDGGAGSDGAPAVLRAVIVDDQPVMSYALQQLLTKRAGCEVVGHVATLEEARVAVERTNPDIVVLDMLLPDTAGIEFLCWLTNHAKATKSVVYSVQPASIYARRCVQAGASAYLGKQSSIEDFVETISLVAQGHTVVCGSVYDQGVAQFVASRESEGIDRLSKRELEVLNLLGQGYSNKDIGRCMCRSDKTVESHRYRIARKLGVANGPELVEYARRWVVSLGSETGFATSAVRS